jgi:hypothetical protein
MDLSLILQVSNIINQNIIHSPFSMKLFIAALFTFKIFIQNFLKRFNCKKFRKKKQVKTTLKTRTDLPIFR